MASPSLTLPLPGGRPCPSGRTSISQPEISSGLASRPMPRRLEAGCACAKASEVDMAGNWIAAIPPNVIARAAAHANAFERLPSFERGGATHAACSPPPPLRSFDILDLAVLAHVPCLNAV